MGKDITIGKGMAQAWVDSGLISEAHLLDRYAGIPESMLPLYAQWYDYRAQYCESLAPTYRVSTDITFALVSVLTQERAWAKTQELATGYLAHYNGAELTEMHGRPLVHQKCIALLQGAEPEAVVGGVKIRSIWFALASHGLANVVVVDRWAMRALFDGDSWLGICTPDHIIGPQAYEIAQQMYCSVANRLSILPCELQAALWCDIRGSGD